MDIFDRIELLLERNNMSQTDLSKATGISTGLISQWEKISKPIKPKACNSRKIFWCISRLSFRQRRFACCSALQAVWWCLPCSRRLWQSGAGHPIFCAEAVGFISTNQCIKFVVMEGQLLTWYICATASLVCFWRFLGYLRLRFSTKQKACLLFFMRLLACLQLQLTLIYAKRFYLRDIPIAGCFSSWSAL